MGSQEQAGGWLPAEAQSGAGHEVPDAAPGGPPPESHVGEYADDSEAADEFRRDVSHVTLKMKELRRLIHPTPTASEAPRP